MAFRHPISNIMSPEAMPWPRFPLLFDTDHRTTAYYHAMYSESLAVPLKMMATGATPRIPGYIVLSPTHGPLARGPHWHR
jgi:hypothetical protein